MKDKNSVIAFITTGVIFIMQFAILVFEIFANYKLESLIFCLGCMTVTGLVFIVSYFSWLLIYLDEKNHGSRK